MENVTLKFKVIGGKQPKEMEDALAKGYAEAYKTRIPGGSEVVLAKMKVYSSQKTTSDPNERTAKKTVFILDEMPPSELILGHTQEIILNGKEEGEVRGTYGIVDGRKFFVKAGRPSAEPEAKRSAGPKSKASKSFS